MIGMLTEIPVRDRCMARPTESDDLSEPDLYWAGHSGWATLPGAVVGIGISVVVMLAAPSIGNLADLTPSTTALIRFWLVLTGWAVAGVVWAYRGASFVYRLTPGHLYVDFGMLYRPVPAFRLADVTSVECWAWRLRRVFGVGSVIVQSSGRDPVRMGGIFRPDRFADVIRRAAKEARSQ
jgi:hypothetical protein